MKRHINKACKFLNFYFLIICLSGNTVNSQAEALCNQQISSNRQIVDKSFQIESDTLSAKDLKSLSAFTDTLILNRFLNEIQLFEKDDSLNPERKVDVIFAGSSSIRKWTSLQNDMEGLNVLNRGFGGSTIPEVIYYSDILIFKHKPKQIVFYAGENDIATGKTDSAKVFNSFVYFQKLVKQKLPQTQLYFISIKLSPSRMKYWNSIKSINEMVRKYCLSNVNCKFIDVNKAMLDKNMHVRTDIYVADQLHLNEKGYQIWTTIILKALKKRNK
jgi:lysophospholipase L1-like esterase